MTKPWICDWHGGALWRVLIMDNDTFRSTLDTKEHEICHINTSSECTADSICGGRT